MSKQMNISHNLVKTSNLDFEKFQDLFLAQKGATLIKSSPHIDPKPDELLSKEGTNSPKPFSLIIISNDKENSKISICGKDEKNKDSQSNNSENRLSPQPIWQFLSANVTEDIKRTGMWPKNNPKINTLKDFSDVLHFRENENKMSNQQLFHLYINKDGGKVIPFIKRFYHKLKNATSLRDINSLKSFQFRFLSDSAYFTEEIRENKEISIHKGSSKFSRIFKTLGEKFIKFEKNHLLSNFWFSHLIVIHPYQNFKILWDIIHLGVIFFWFLNIPLLLAFQEMDSMDVKSSFYTIIFLSLDIFLNFNTAYFINGSVEKRRKMIVSNYVNKHFFFDVVTMLAILLGIFFQVNENKYRLYFHSIKLIFFLKINTIMEISHRLSEKFLLKENFQNIIALFKILFISIFVAHLFACFWYLVSIESEEFFESTWISNRGLMSYSWHIKYLYSIYWACITMMTVGYGDIIPQNEAEIIFCLISVVLGCAVYAYNINSIGMILQDLNKANVEFDRKINIINQFMNKKKINQDLQMRIREYLRFIWKEENTQNFEDEQKIIGLLSNSLKDELLLNAYGSILKKFPMFFANFTEKSLTKAVSIIKDIRLFPEEEIFSENNQDNLAIYFIIKGKVELANEAGIALKELKVGDLFGEIGFFSGKPRKFSVRTKDFTTLFSINRDEFINILKKNPEDFEKFCMIQDQINLYNNFLPLKIRCFCCNQIGHLCSNCSLIHFQADNEKIIRKFNFYLAQERSKFVRKHGKQNSLQKKKHLEKSITAIQILIKDEEAANQSYYSSDNSIPSPETPEWDDGEIKEDFFVKSNKVKMHSISNKKMSQTEDSKILPSSNENIKSNPNMPNIDNCTLQHPEVTSSINLSSPQIKENGSPFNHEICEENKSDEKRSMEKILFESNVNIDRVDDIFAKDVDNFDIKRSLNHDSILPSRLRSHENIVKKSVRLDTTPKYNNSEEKRRKNEKNLSNASENKFYSSISKNKLLPLTNINSMNWINEKKSTAVEEKPTINRESTGTAAINNEKFMDYFETVWCFKSYFPENNIKNIISITNKRKSNRRCNKMKEERKKSLEARLSKYTFFPQEMKLRLPEEIRKRMRMNSKKSKKGTCEPISNFELKIKSNKDSFKKNDSGLNSKKRLRKYFTTKFLEQKFSDVVKFIMSRPNLKKILKRNK